MASPASVASWFDRIMAGLILGLVFVIGAAKAHAPVDDAQRQHDQQQWRIEHRDDRIFLDD